jgi:hypothetical protein
MCEIDIDDKADVWRESRPKARKAHWCGTCGRAIPVGEVYGRVSCVIDGSAWSEACCLECDADRVEFGGEHGVMLSPSSFGEELVQCIGSEGMPEDGSAYESEWSPMARRIEERRDAAMATA